MSAATELSSITTALEELAARIAAIAEGYRAAHRDDLAGELFEVDRGLAAATRRLARSSAAAKLSEPDRSSPT